MHDRAFPHYFAHIFGLRILTRFALALAEVWRGSCLCWVLEVSVNKFTELQLTFHIAVVVAKQAKNRSCVFIIDKLFKQQHNLFIMFIIISSIIAYTLIISTFMDGHLQTIKSISSFTAQINHSKIAQFKKMSQF